MKEKKLVLDIWNESSSNLYRIRLYFEKKKKQLTKKCNEYWILCAKLSKQINGKKIIATAFVTWAQTIAWNENGRIFWNWILKLNILRIETYWRQRK